MLLIKASQSSCHSRRRRFNARTRSSSLSAPFCPLEFLLSDYQTEGWLVGAVGIEPTILKDWVAGF
jgi:hypothetical protein